MKYIFLVIILLQFYFVGVSQDKLFVAVDGNDSNAGTITNPFKSLEVALNKVASSKSKVVSIFLRAGRYSPTKAIEITPTLLNNRHLQIAAYNTEAVTITGAVKITPQWKPYKGNILQASIEKGLSIDQLICNNDPLVMARYPNYDSTARVFKGTAADALSPQRVKGWTNPKGGYVHALHQAEWGDFHYRITGKTNRDSLLLEGGWQNNRPAAMHKQYRFVENIFEELDAPGEWFYNSSTGTLYLYPPKDIDVNKASFERSILNDIVRLIGSEEQPVQNVSIQGITFTGTNRTFMLTKEPLLRSDWTIYRGGAIITVGAKNIDISNCTFTALGGHAIFVSKFNRNINIQHNYIHHIGGNSVAFVGDTAAVRSPAFNYNQFVPINEMDMTPGPKTNNYPANCMVYDNLIHDIGTIEKQVAGIEIDIAMDITASHNTIYNVPRSGVNIGDGCWGGHIIEFNDVFNTVLETGDHGAFNSWGRDRFWLSNISSVNKLVEQYPDLPLLDVIKPITLRNNRFHCEHGWDIDLDDGSSNYHIYNNLCLNGGLKLREGFYRVVENNILVNNTFHPHVWYDKSMDVFAHNIVTTEYAPVRISNWGKMVDSNFFIYKSGMEAARKNKTDLNSKGGDPLFINEAAGDFRVKPTSKALEIGFKNFPMNDFGVVSKVLKQKAAKPKITHIAALEAGVNGKTMEWLGATIKNIETLGEQSASGTPDRNGILIIKVTQGSIAEKSGLMPGDVIRQIEGKDVAGIQEMLNALQAIMWQGYTDTKVWHNQQSKDMHLLLK